MSGVKWGALPPGAVILPLALPLAVGAVALGGGIAVCRGAVRLTGEVYDRIASTVDRSLQQEFQKTSQAIDDTIRRIRSMKELTYSTPSFDLLQETIFSAEQEEIGKIDDIVRMLEEEKKTRTAFERKRRLRRDVSGKIQKDIEAYRRKKEDLERALKEREDALKKQAEQKKMETYLKALDHAYSLCRALDPFYPEICKEARAALGCAAHTESAVRRVVLKQSLQEKLQCIEDSSIRRNLDRIRGIRMKYESEPTLQLLPDQRRKEFFDGIKELVGLAETGTSLDSPLDDIQKRFAEDYQESLRLDQERRFEETRLKVSEALGKRGYSTIRESEQGNYFLLEGEKADGRQARISILLPTADDESGKHILSEIEQDGYEDEKAWNKEGRELFREMESLGVLTEVDEMMTHFKGRLTENGVQMIKKRLQEEYPDRNFELVIVENSNQILIREQNGGTFEADFNFGPSITEQDFMSTVRDEINGSSGGQVPERERLREEE